MCNIVGCRNIRFFLKKVSLTPLRDVQIISLISFTPGILALN